jgi:hypothetical protein
MASVTNRKVLMSTSLLRRSRLALGAAVAFAALAVSAPALATPITPPTGPTPTFGPTASPTQGIIMRDGGICDPIRHMGC